MLRHPGRYTATLAAGLALLLGGCGGSSDESTGDLALADPGPPPAAAAAPAEAAPELPGDPSAAPEASVSSDAMPAGTGMPAPATAETPAVEAPAAPAVEAPETPVMASVSETPAAGGASRRVENAAATDDLLQIAQGTAAAIPVPAPAAAGATPDAAMASAAPGGAARAPGEPELPGDPTPPMAASADSSRGGNEAALRQASQPPPGMPGDPGSGSGAAIPGDSGLASSGGSSGSEPDYSTAAKGAETFLAAVKSKDVERIADALALRSVSDTEGSAKYKATFQALLDRSVDPQVLDDMYEVFKDMKIVGANTVKSSGSRGIIIGHQNDKREYITRTLTMRHEKAGWKVLDISGQRVQRMPNYNRNNQQNLGSGS